MCATCKETRARCLSDGEFDLYFSNAVIEHVGSEDRQRAFVREALRVAGRVFVTTEPLVSARGHTRLPLVHWLPEPAAHRAYDLARKGWAKGRTGCSGHASSAASSRPRSYVNLGLTLVAIT